MIHSAENRFVRLNWRAVNSNLRNTFALAKDSSAGLGID